MNIQASHRKLSAAYPTLAMLITSAALSSCCIQQRQMQAGTPPYELELDQQPPLAPQKKDSQGPNKDNKRPEQFIMGAVLAPNSN